MSVIVYDDVCPFVMSGYVCFLSICCTLRSVLGKNDLGLAGNFMCNPGSCVITW